MARCEKEVEAKGFLSSRLSGFLRGETWGHRFVHLPPSSRQNNRFQRPEGSARGMQDGNTWGTGEDVHGGIAGKSFDTSETQLRST